MNKNTRLIKTGLAFIGALTFTYMFSTAHAQNSMTGDGFGGRSWYVPHNFQVGAYSAFTVCGVDSQLYAWGRNLYGELGNGTTINSDVPVAVIGMNHVKFYTTGYVSGVIKSDNSAWVWGTANSTSGFSGFTTIAEQVLTDVKFADGGVSHIVFVKNDGTVWGAGQNVFGQLGNGTTSTISTPIITPVQMTGITNAVRAVAIGYGIDYPSASIILLKDSTVKITGGNGWFAAANSTVPVTITELSRIIDIKGGATAAFALNADGDVYAFGHDIGPTLFGIMGLGAYTGVYTPPTKIVFPPGAAPIVALSANNDGYTALALDENGNVYGWGINHRGEIGDGTYVNKSTPVLVATNVIDIYAAETFSYILKADNTLWASGQSRDATGSIWMNVVNQRRNVFTQIDPTIAPMNLCLPKPFGVVPIQLLNFNCTVRGNSANLNWESATEINADHYTVEYSQNGIDFHQLVSIPAKGSNSRYSYVHRLVNGTAFYRLKMTDKEGRSTYSEIRMARFGHLLSYTLAPNPATNLLYINSPGNNTGFSITLLSVNGTVVKIFKNINNGQSINIADLAGGTYLLKITDRNEQVSYQKFIKL